MIGETVSHYRILRKLGGGGMGVVYELWAIVLMAWGAARLALTLGRFGEAITLNRRAIELDPLRVIAHFYLGNHAYNAGRWEEAEAALGKALELNPQYPAAHTRLGGIYLARQSLRVARARLQTAGRRPYSDKRRPALRNLERDPLYTAFLKKMKLPVD